MGIESPTTYRQLAEEIIREYEENWISCIPEWKVVSVSSEKLPGRRIRSEVVISRFLYDETFCPVQKG